MTLPPATALLLFPAMILFLEVGQRLRNRSSTAEGNGAIEGAVFGLFGLLLAFTFSGAVARYDAHRALLTEEVNAIGTAYLRLDLLPPQAQPHLRQLFRDYTTSRLHLFEAPGAEITPETLRLQNQIWQQSLAAITSTGSSADARLLVPALNAMIDITSTRQIAFNMHPPAIVSWLLVIFSCGSAFMAGYGLRIQNRDWVYSVALAAAVTLTVYATLEIEYPRQGFIHLSSLDRALVTLRNSMN